MSTTIASMGDGRHPNQGELISSMPGSKAPMMRWLRRFASRHAALLIIQGASVAILTILAGASLIIFLDARGWIDDGTRWILSLCMYAVAFGMGCWFGLARLWNSPPLTRLATIAESVCPDLKESLLSCVELQQVAPEKRHFSSDFLGAIENQVSDQLGTVSISKLLPWRRVGKPLIAALLGSLLLGGLCGFPNLDMPQRLARALFPFLDLSRPSRTKILVHSPARDGATVPENQRIVFEIEIQGEESESAILELKSLSDEGRPKIERLEMAVTQKSPLLFSCTAPIGTRSLEYRFLSGDEKTKYRTLIASPRPRVDSFYHRITFPEYTRLGTIERTSETGGLTILSNASFIMGVKPSIPLQSASILVDSLDASEKTTLPLTYDPARGVWTGAWNAAGDARFQVKMVADVPDADQVIENTFSPFYEVDTVPDHSPSVTWAANDQTFWNQIPAPNQSWIVAPEEILILAASAADDLPNVVLEQEISINRQPWVSVPMDLPTQPWNDEGKDQARDLVTWASLNGVENPSRIASQWNWDVLTAGATSGDLIAVRVAAKDSLGQKAYTPTIQFSVASVGFDRRRHEALFLKASLAPQLKELAEWMKAQKTELRPKLVAIKERNVPIEQRRATGREIEKFVEEWKRQSDQIQQRASSVVGSLPGVLDQSELEIVERILAKWDKESISNVALFTHPEHWEGLAESAQPNPVLVEKLLPLLQQQVDQAAAALDGLEAFTAQLNEHYRQLIGHDFLTALTKDLMFLWQHQKEQIARADKLDFTMLVRSQVIAEQYIDAVVQLAEQMEPSVSNQLRDQLKNLYRFLDQTRLELRDLTQAEPSSQAHQNLLQRIQRSASDLQGQHWAFNLDGGLWWSVADYRRNLIQLGHGTGNAMTRVLGTVMKQPEWLRDSRLDSELLQKLRGALLDEVAFAQLPATSVMMDRRDFHLRRQPVDPMFPGDMGLANRAWSAEIEKWFAEQPGTTAWSETLTELQSIVQAYRVLEAAHEIQDIRANLESLRRHEQYDWGSLEGQLSHLKQWESVNHRIDITQNWMREAGFPNPIPDKLNALRWSAPANRVRQVLEPRRNAGNASLRSASQELQEHLAEWSDVERQAQPTIDAARKLLARYAPSVSALAQKAAAQTRELQKQTESLTSANPQEVRPPAEDTESSKENASTESQDATLPRETSAREIAQQQNRVEQSIAQLQDALLDAAMKQNILDAAQLQAAKDSDRALDLLDRVHEPMTEANQALSNLQRNSQQAEQVSQAASQAAQKQNQAAKALETIASHFDLLEQSLADPDRSQQATLESQAELERSRQNLAQQQQSLEGLNQENPGEDSAKAKQDFQDAAKDPLESYRKADQLNDMARKSPDELLKKLEAELQRNRPMQKELSEISKSNLADSISQLKNAANQEANLAQNLENSDAQAAESKEIQIQQLKALADSSDRLAADLMNKATQAINRMNQPETVRSLNSTAEGLRSAANKARNTDARATQESLNQKRDKLMESVQKAQKELGEAAPRIQQLVDQNAFKEDKQRQAQLTEMQSWQSLMRDDMVRRTKDQTREREQNADRLKKESEQREKELEQKNKERNQVVENANKQPENEGLKTQIDQKTKEAQQAAQRLESAKKIAETAQNIAKQGQEQQQRVEQAQRANLDAQNPLAALGREQLTMAKDQLDQIQSGLQNLQGKASQLAERAPTSDALAQSQPQQRSVQDTVEQVAEQLSRSARHEQRLKNEPGQDALNKQSEQIASNAQPSVDQAARQIDQSAENAKKQESEQLKQSRAEANPRPNRGPSGEPALQNLKQAENALKQSADELQKTFTELADGQPRSQDAAANMPPSGPSSNSSPVQSAKQLARMLDSLDQQVNSGADPASLAKSDAPSPNAQSEGATPKPTADGDPSQGNPDPQKGPPGDKPSGPSDPSAPKDSSSPAVQDALREAAEQVSSQLQNERLANRQANKQKSASSKKPSSQPGGQPDDKGMTRGQPTGNSALPPALLEAGNQWGRLREKRADDVIEGRREIYDPEFSDAIRAYYRALGKQASSLGSGKE